MSIVYIELNGCDDTTYAEAEVSAEELIILKKVFKVINKQAKRICKPTAKICSEKPDYWEPDEDAKFLQRLEGENK